MNNEQKPITKQWLLDQGACYYPNGKTSKLGAWLDERLPISIDELGAMDEIPGADKLWALYRLMSDDQARLAARRQSLTCIDKWDAPLIVLDWLHTGNESLRDAASDAAWEAARSAARDAAWEAAKYAARSAAWSAACSEAWDAACSASWDAASSAAWDAARDAARDAACSAARSAAWDAASSSASSAARDAASSEARYAAVTEAIAILQGKITNTEGL